MRGFFGLTLSLYLTIMVHFLDSSTISRCKKCTPEAPALALRTQTYGYHSCQRGNTRGCAV